jgi:hypothetical protein
MLAQQYPARPKCACPLLAQFGRHANDILYHGDRQRLKVFIYRLAGSRDASAIERRAHLIVAGIMGGISEGFSVMSLNRLAIDFAWARALLFLASGWYGTAIGRALTAFGRHYDRGTPYHRARLLNVLCKTLDEALSAGREGEMIQRMRLWPWIGMNG